MSHVESWSLYKNSPRGAHFTSRDAPVIAPEAAEVGTLATNGTERQRASIRSSSDQSLEHTPSTNYVNGPSASAPPALTLRDMLTRSCIPHYLPRSPYPTPPPPLQPRASRSGLRDTQRPRRATALRCNHSPPTPSDQQARSPRAHHCRLCSRACSQRL